MRTETTITTTMGMHIEKVNLLARNALVAVSPLCTTTDVLFRSRNRAEHYPDGGKGFTLSL